MQLSKTDVAKAHLVTAVRSTFRGEHPASIYLLGASAREILTTLGEKANIRTLLRGIADDTGESFKELVNTAHRHANFLKHADRDPSAILEELDERSADDVLFVAGHDYLRVTNQQPIELEVFQAWWLAVAHEKVSDAPYRAQGIIRDCIKMFPGIRSASRVRRLELGLSALEQAQSKPNSFRILTSAA